jgi:hypothetical protein
VQFSFPFILKENTWCRQKQNVTAF